MVQLDRAAEPDELVNESDVQNASWLARRLVVMLKDIATLKRRFWPRRIDFEDRVVDSSMVTQYRFTHNFGGRVRWWPVDATGDPPFLARHSASDNNTLVLISNSACTVTIRVEEAG